MVVSLVEAVVEVEMVVMTVANLHLIMIKGQEEMMIGKGRRRMTILPIPPLVERTEIMMKHHQMMRMKEDPRDLTRISVRLKCLS